MSSEARRLRRQKRKEAGQARRLTEAGALELAIAVAQYFYYEHDAPIMTDTEYDQLEARYIRYKRQTKSPGGIMCDILKQPGSSETIKTLMLEWRK